MELGILLGTRFPSMVMPPSFASIVYGNAGTSYSPIVQSALNANQTRPRVHWSNPLVTSQEEIQPDISI